MELTRTEVSFFFSREAYCQLVRPRHVLPTFAHCFKYMYIQRRGKVLTHRFFEQTSLREPVERVYGCARASLSDFCVTLITLLQCRCWNLYQ